MTGRVALFGPEGGTEGVHVAEGLAEGLHVQLAADSQVGGLAEEILRIVHFAAFGLGHVFQRQGGHLEHFARAFAVAGGDEGRMHVHKAPLRKESVEQLRRQRADAEHRVEGVRPGTQVGDGAQVFEGVALFLQGIVGGAQAHHFDLGGLELKGLLHAGGGHQITLGPDGAAQRHLQRVGEVRRLAVLQHDLQVFEVGAVVQLDKAERLAVAHGAHPAGNGNVGQGLGGRLMKQLANARVFLFHGSSSSSAFWENQACLPSMAAPIMPASAPRRASSMRE